VSNLHKIFLVQDVRYPTNLTFAVQDLWQKKNLGKYKGLFAAKVPSHAVVMVKIKP